jgi:hypothetical protein
MKKLLLALPVLALFVISVAAVGAGVGLRGAGGSIDNVAGDSSFIASSPDVRFSVWMGHTHPMSYPIDVMGQGSIQVTTETNSDERVRLYVSFRDLSIVSETSDMMVVSAKSRGTYWKKTLDHTPATMMRFHDGMLTFTYDKNTHETTVMNTGGVSFEVSEIPTWKVWH